MAEAAQGFAGDLQKRSERSFVKLFARQHVKMQKLCFYRLEKEFSVLFLTFSGEAPSGSTGFACASPTCRACWQGTAFPSHIHKTFRLLFAAAALCAASNSQGCKALEVVVFCGEVLCCELVRALARRRAPLSQHAFKHQRLM